MNGDQDEYEIENHVTWLLDDFNDPDGYDSLSDAQRAACLVWTMRWTVSNGGYESWLETYGQRTRDLVEALSRIGAEPYAGLVRDVVLAALSFEAADEESRLADISTPRLSELDERFFALNRDEDLLNGYLRPFLRRHHEDFPSMIDDL